MPLTITGKRILRSFKSRYGNKGDRYFYAWERSHPWVKKKRSIKIM